MDWKRALGLALASVALALVVWGVFFARLPSRIVTIKIDLPPAETPRPPKPVDVFIGADGAIRVDGAPSTLEHLPRDIAAKASSSPSKQQIRIRASENVSYAAYTAVLQRCSAAGWTKVGIITSEKAAP